MSNDHDPLAKFRREPRPVSKDDQAQESLTEHQALRLAIGALQQIPDHNPDLMFVLQEAYENGKINARLLDIAPDLQIALQSTQLTMSEAIPMMRNGFIEPAIKLLETSSTKAGMVLSQATPVPPQEVNKQPDIEPEM